MTYEETRHSLGVAEMDAQHEQLYALFDRVEDSPTVIDHEAMNGLLAEIEEYLLFHFSSEEHFIRMYKAPGFASHQTDHEAAGNKVVRFLNDFEHGRLNPRHLRIFLTGWLMEHSSTCDEEYAQVVRTKRSAGA